uniref:Ig-like domain-containing protein n=1 Tax=Strongyloides papillosus TaxID=174720 RepID=A0A0N5CCK2_STREA
MFVLKNIILLLLIQNIFSQTDNISPELKIKISNQPFMASNIMQLKVIEWTMLGRTASQTIYCVSENPMTELRFTCPECVEKNYSDITNVLKTAEDLTKMSGFPTIALQNVPAKANWTGINILCQGRASNKTFNSLPAKVIVKYIRQPYIVDGNNMKPDLTSKQGYRFYVDCLKSENGKCQEFSSRKNILKCVVEAYPKPTVYKWYKNGIEMSERSSIIEFNVDMIGESIQCAANNDLHRENNMLESQAVQIFPLISPKVVEDNFKAVRVSRLLQPGNRINMKQSIVLSCNVEGNPKPQISWKHRKLSGEIVNAECLEDNDNNENTMFINNAVRVKSSCLLIASDYSSSGQYWCTGCFNISNNSSKCSSNFNDAPNNYFDMEVQGPPVVLNEKLSTEKINNGKDILIRINYCSNPKPLLSKEVVFDVDQHIVQEGQRWKNIKFVEIKQNEIESICYSANLVIYSEMHFDKNIDIKLIVHNTFGQVNINVPLNFDFDVINNDALSKWAKYGIITFSFLFVTILIVIIYIKNRIVKIRNKNYNDSEEEKNDKVEKDNLSFINDQNSSRTNLSNKLNLPMIDETVIYEDYVDFKIYGTVKKQSVFLSHEAFV